ncbi:hypothetical protein KIN20_024716 [Parelaphostrongylus tenuis]|uniref:Receptor ligand binding region domain-containing protein n=1 Tax=Parelaphostrongylus tenuis TaxID=148309 RepID=A0AAD5NBC9_PARTN|nr:hypothetical protein KIN20_024716 [Parelaphostrongylus tenuis]
MSRKNASEAEWKIHGGWGEDAIAERVAKKFIYDFDECDERIAAGITISMSANDNVDVIIGPTCNAATFVSAVISGYFNKPLLTWGLSTLSEFDNNERFPMVCSMAVHSLSLSRALLRLLRNFEWNQFAFVFSKHGKNQLCSTLEDDIQTVTTLTHGEFTINYFAEITAMSSEAIKDVLRKVARRARTCGACGAVVRGALRRTRGQWFDLALMAHQAHSSLRVAIVCLAEDLGHKRKFMLAAHDAGLINSEFVYIFAAPSAKGFNVLKESVQCFNKTSQTSHSKEDQGTFDELDKIEVLSHPTYGPNAAPSDYGLDTFIGTPPARTLIETYN